MLQKVSRVLRSLRFLIAKTSDICKDRLQWHAAWSVQNSSWNFLSSIYLRIRGSWLFNQATFWEVDLWNFTLLEVINFYLWFLECKRVCNAVNEDYHIRLINIDCNRLENKSNNFITF